MARVSVIIPVYNVEKYLRECLDSVINQTLSDIEIICVDDGSTDTSGELLDGYAAVDTRVKVIHKVNEGYGKAVNVGIDAASGEYIGIVEPDDYVDADMYETLYAKIKEVNTDFIKSDYYSFWDDITEYTSYLQENEFYDTVFRPTDYLRIYRNAMANWTGLYKREFLNKYHIRHNETPGASYQDTGFAMLVYAYAATAYIINKAFYHYRLDNPNSSVKNTGKEYCCYDEDEYVYGILKNSERYGELKKFLTERRFLGMVFRFNHILNEAKPELLKRYSIRLNELKDSGELDISLLSQEETEILYSVMREPEKLYKRLCGIAEKAQKLVFDCENVYDKIIIYGAGIRGKRTYDFLNCKDKIVGFAVSDAAKCANTLCGVPVCEIEQYGKYRENALVLIAVKNPDAVDEIERRLCEPGFKNIAVTGNIEKEINLML